MPKEEAITEASVWRTPFGAAVEPEVKYTHRHASSVVGAADRSDGSAEGKQRSGPVAPSSASVRTSKPTASPMRPAMSP